MASRASTSVTPSDYRPSKRPRLSKSTLRVLSVWDQLAERYNKRLDEDDIVDLYSGTIISDRGVLKSAGKDYNIGHFAPDDSQGDQEQDQAESEQEQDDDVDELDTLPAQSPSRVDGTMASTSELLRAVRPLSETTDADDLNEFLEAEKRRRELLGDQDGEDDISTEELAALRDALRQPQEGEEQPEVVQGDESEDELGVWQHEASVVYHIAPNESEPEVAEDEQKIPESTDSDEEFATLLVRPSRVEKRKRISSSSSQRGMTIGDTSVPNTPSVLHSRSGSRQSPEDTPVCVTPPAASYTRVRSLQYSSTPDTPLANTRTRFASRMSSKDTPLPDTPATSSTRFASCTSNDTPVSGVHPTSLSTCFAFRTPSESTSVSDTISTSGRSVSRTPRTPVYPSPSHSVAIDPAQSPQHLLYQAMQQLSYALSATMMTLGSPAIPPPPTGSWGTFPPGFAPPWGPQGITLDDDKTLVDGDSTPDVESDSGILENERRQRRSTSTICSRKDARKKGIHSNRSRLSDHEDKLQGKQVATKRRALDSPSPDHVFKKPISTIKKKSNTKSKS